MSLTPSTMVALGSSAPDFELLDVVTKSKKPLSIIKGKHGTVIMFICNHCPYVKHIQQQLVAVANRYLNDGIEFVAINSNDVEKYPEDAPEKMVALANELNFPFPYLYDETQQVAKAYDAACTPDFFVYDHNLTLVYRGQFDDSRPGNNSAVTGKDLCATLDALLANQPIPTEQKPSMGCNIKWRENS